MDDVEIPEYFICPISLQIMKDPVTVITGITYDRDSILHWQSHGRNKTCPVTKQPLPVNSNLTPNHTLHRLIQSWRTTKGIDRISSPKPPLTNLIKDLKLQHLYLPTLRKLEALATDKGSSNNMVCIQEAGVGKAMVSIIVNCYKKGEIFGMKEALNVLYHVETSSTENDQILDSLMWVLGFDACNLDILTMKTHAILLLKGFIKKANSRVLERLKIDFFKTIIRILRENLPQQGIQAALHVMLSASPWGRNCMMMVEAGAVFELVELELGSPEKSTTELTMEVLFHLCSSADGRAELVGHAAGIAVITKRILKSQKVDERAVLILSLVSKFSGTSWVVQEMTQVGTVGKLCMILQAERPSYLKDEVREILRRHSNVWKDSTCVDFTQLTRYSR